MHYVCRKKCYNRTLEIVRSHCRKIRGTKCVVPTFQKNDYCSSRVFDVYRAVNNNVIMNYVKIYVKQIFSNNIYCVCQL